MDYIIGWLVIIAIVVFFFIYLIAQDSKKETKKEKYGEAVGKFAYMTADKVAGIAKNITEPTSKKILNAAQCSLAHHNSKLYRCDTYYEDCLEKLLEINASFSESLELLKLTKEDWCRLGKKLFYLGVIKRASRDSWDYSKKNWDSTRKMIYENDLDYKSESSTWQSYYLREALATYGIPKEDFVKYGDTVIEMYNLRDDKILENYGYIESLMPMPNNFHLF